MSTLKPLNLPVKLHKAPKSQAHYGISLKDAKQKYIEFADPRATRSMLALMDLAAVNGGAACHWGGPSAMTETWTALHAIMFKHDDWFNHYNFVNDIGHAENGIYALRCNLGYGDLTLNKLKTFRAMNSELTGHGESHLYPEGVLLSNGPLGSAFPQAQGLAVADKIIGNKRVTVVSLSDGASMEGEAKEAFAAIPGLASKGKLNPFVMLLSDNNTKLGGRIDKDSFSMKGQFEALHSLGWKIVMVENAHDLLAVHEELEKAIQMAKSDDSAPVCVWLKTVKGYGIKSTAESSSGGHGFPLKAYDEGIHQFLKEIWGADEVPAEFTFWAKELTVKPEKKSSSASAPKDKIQIGVAKALTKAAKEGLPVFSITSDLAGSTGVKGFQSEFPDRVLDVGVAESNMISTAIGMSKLGFIPVVDTFAAFGVTKGNLPLIMGSLSQSPVMAIFSHTGFQDAADGASHQSLTYLSALASIPHLNLVNLASAKEAEEYVYKAAKKIAADREAGKDGESYIFFLGRENFSLEAKEGLDYDLHRSQLLCEGEDACIVVSGSLVEKALVAREKLAEKGFEVAVINHSFVNNSDFDFIGETIERSGGRLVTLEDHQLVGGMGAQLIHQLKLKGFNFIAESLAVKGEFGQSAYMADELYAKHGLDATSVEKTVEDLLDREWEKPFSPEAIVELLTDKIPLTKEEAEKKVFELLGTMTKQTADVKEKLEETGKVVFETGLNLLNDLKSKIKK
ncbi:MAG: transketolase C-terminal domain-containing protein [Bacteriovoracaceae bacterium]